MKKSVKPVYTSCVFFNDESACRKLRKDRNCYQCPVAQCSSLRFDVCRLQSEIKRLNDENERLKIMLADQLLLDTDFEIKSRTAEKTPLNSSPQNT